jgi:hypothetical protein
MGLSPVVGLSVRRLAKPTKHAQVFYPDLERSANKTCTRFQLNATFAHFAILGVLCDKAFSRKAHEGSRGAQSMATDIAR